MTNNTNNHGISQAQLDAHWMPFTGNREFKKDPRIIVSAEGNYYTDSQGRKIFDGLSGLWTCGAGHSRPEITEAVSKQAKAVKKCIKCRLLGCMLLTCYEDSLVSIYYLVCMI